MSIFSDSNKEECFYILQADFPEMVVKLDAFWGNREFKEYLRFLMIEGDVEYTDNTVSALFRLNVLHDKDYPQFSKPSLPFVCK